MPVTIIEGNLLDARENLILHQVNCRGKMQSGVAKQIRDKWEQVYTEYIYHYNLSKRSGIPLLGKMQIVPINQKQAVVNLFGQDNFGYSGDRFTDYEALYTALEKTSKVAKANNLSVALPYNMGCDRGGAKWNIVLSMIEELFANHDKPVVVYKYNSENN